MARLFTIESMEGNSNLGNPVFSNYGKMQNYQYLVLSPVKEDARRPEEADDLAQDNMQFRVKKPLADQDQLKRKPATADARTVSVNQRRQQIQNVLVSHFIIYSTNSSYFLSSECIRSPITSPERKRERPRSEPGRRQGLSSRGSSDDRWRNSIQDTYEQDKLIDVQECAEGVPLESC